MTFGTFRVDTHVLNIILALISLVLALGLGQALLPGSSQPHSAQPSATPTPSATTTAPTSAAPSPSASSAQESTPTMVEPAESATQPSPGESATQAAPNASTTQPVPAETTTVTATPTVAPSAATETTAPPGETTTAESSAPSTSPAAETTTQATTPAEQTPAESAAPVAPTKPEPTALEIRQGGVIFVGDFDLNNGVFNKCTLGYVHKETKIAYTAGHCGDHHSPGVPVYMYTTDGTLLQIGSWYGTSENYLGNHGEEVNKFDFINGDMGYIALEESTGVVIPETANAMSGDTIYRELPTNGEEVCAYRSQAMDVTCGRMYQLNGSYIVYNTTSVKGESGGPIWRKAGGFLGVISATSVISLLQAGKVVDVPVVWAALNNLADTLFD